MHELDEKKLKKREVANNQFLVKIDHLSVKTIVNLENCNSTSQLSDEFAAINQFVAINQSISKQTINVKEIIQESLKPTFSLSTPPINRIF